MYKYSQLFPIIPNYSPILTPQSNLSSWGTVTCGSADAIADMDKKNGYVTPAFIHEVGTRVGIRVGVVGVLG
jgi:hypothetical protein